MVNVSPGALREVARLLGVSGNVPPELAEHVSELYSELKTAEATRSIWRVFNIDVNLGSVIFDGAFPIEGNSLAALLRGSERAVLMAATLGVPVDRLINRLQAIAMDDAVILDACASVEIDAFCDCVEGEIFNALDEGCFLTMRFSPGYGDVSLTESGKIISALGAQKAIGLTTTKAGMLFPIKSITAIIGITDKKLDRARSCSRCGINETCRYKKRGDTCGL